MQNLHSKGKILLKSTHFQNNGIKYAGYNSWQQRKPCSVKLPTTSVQKQILLINQVSLQTQILGERNKSFLKAVSSSHVTWVKWFSVMASTVCRIPSIWYLYRLGDESWDLFWTIILKNWKFPSHQKKLCFSIYMEGKKMPLKISSTLNDSLDLNSRLLGGWMVHPTPRL